LKREFELIGNKRPAEGEPLTISQKMKAMCEVCDNFNEAAFLMFNFGVNFGIRKARVFNTIHAGSTEGLKDLLGAMKKAAEETDTNKDG
jgi:hypothetical protein